MAKRRDEAGATPTTGPAPEWYVKQWLAAQGRKGGASRSKRKLEAVKRNAVKARAALARKRKRDAGQRTK